MNRLNEKRNIKIRNELLTQLRSCSRLFIREIAEILKINSGVVQRIKT